MHLTFNKFGVRQTVGLPGSGLSETSYLVKDKAAGSDPTDVHHSIHQGEGMGCELEGCGCLLVVLVFAVVMIYFGANSLHLLPANLLSQLLHNFTQWLANLGF
jgi:hypothetical protein